MIKIRRPIDIAFASNAMRECQRVTKRNEERERARGKMARKKRRDRRSNNGGSSERRPRRGREGREGARPRPTKSEARREKIELNWGQIDSSRESLHSIWRLPNRVRLTPFKTFNGPSWKVLKDARVEPS